MRIYVASSWKNEKKCLLLARVLRNWGHEVDCFCDASSGRYVFSYAELGDVSKLDAVSALEEPKVVRAFQEDRRWIDWADAVVLLLPCGKSAHLEAGYAVGRGKKLVIFGEFPKGELDVMYGFANYLARNVDELEESLNRLERSLDRVNREQRRRGADNNDGGKTS